MDRELADGQFSELHVGQISQYLHLGFRAPGGGCPIDDKDRIGDLPCSREKQLAGRHRVKLSGYEPE